VYTSAHKRQGYNALLHVEVVQNGLENWPYKLSLQN
jgi:hypothetical protein